MSLNILLLSDEMIKDRSTVHGNTDPKLLYPDIKVAQDMYLLPILGTGLYNRLQTDVNNNTLTGDYKALMDNYVIDALLYHTLAELPMSISFQFWNKGLLRKTGQDTETPSMSDMVDISNHYRNRGQWYCNRLRLYLLEDNGKLFPETIRTVGGVDTVYPDKNAFDIPIYLGDDDCGCVDHGLRKPYDNA